MRKTQKIISPAKYDVIPLSSSLSKGIPSSSPSILKGDVPSPLPEITKGKNAEKDANFDGDDMEILLAVENEEIKAS